MVLENIVKIERGKDVRLNILIYGLTDAGKTTLLGSAHKDSDGRICKATSPSLLLDVDGGTQSLVGNDIDIFRPQSFSEIQEAYDFLRYENKTYKSVGIDSLTEIQRKLSMGEIIGTLSGDSGYDNLAEHVPPTRYDWLQSGEQMRRFIRAFRELAYLPDRKRRIHVIFGALEKYDENRNIVCPSLPGILGLEVGASVDLMGRLSVEEVDIGKGDEEKLVDYRLLSMKEYVDDNEIKYLGRARVPRNSKFPKEIWQPTMDKIVRLWTSRDTKKRRKS